MTREVKETGKGAAPGVLARGEGGKRERRGFRFDDGRERVRGSRFSGGVRGKGKILVLGSCLSSSESSTAA